MFKRLQIMSLVACLKKISPHYCWRMLI